MMVNKVPAYTISAGGRYAVLASRSHQGTVSVMVPACCDALESTGVETDDIYVIEAPSDSLLPGLARELSKTGFCSTVVVLAVLPEGDAVAESILNGMTMTDFPRPVVPGMVIGERDMSGLARVAQDAARQAVELTNLAGILDEMREASNGIPAEALEETLEAPAPKKRGRPAKAAAATAPATRSTKRSKTAPAPKHNSKTGKRGRGRPRKTAATA